MGNATLEAIQAHILDTYNMDEHPEALFILGAPRTGSTLLYQMIVSCFDLPFLSNMTNDMLADVPIVGVALQKSMQTPISFHSKYGKTNHPQEPSEASAVMMQWFESGHPSQSVATDFKSETEQHMQRTFAASLRLFKAPLVIKNAWNCYRIQAITKVLPKAKFIWICRDIRASALSDLNARQTTKHDLNSWNSATPSNYKYLLKRPVHEQVVENQFEMNTAIKTGLKSHAQNGWVKLFYEDVISDPDAALAQIAGLLQRSLVRDPHNITVSAPRTHLEVDAFGEQITSYVAEHEKRLAEYMFG
jgi:LPS sulfotransferase NodH